MTEASAEGRRRSRYRRDGECAPEVLSAAALQLLGLAIEVGLVSACDLVRLTGLSPKAVRQQMRRLFDAGLVDVRAVPRDALELPGTRGRAPVLGGSAPNLYSATRAGARLLGAAGAGAWRRSQGRTSLFLAHARLITEVRVWLAWSARVGGHTVERWHEGSEAEMPLSGRLVLRPDAWFACRLGVAVLVGVVEADCGTERGTTRWGQKLAGYRELFEGGRLLAATGYRNARVLVVTPDARRRERLAAHISRSAPAWLAERFWLAEREVLGAPGLAASRWQQAGTPAPQPLLGSQHTVAVAEVP